MSQNQFISDQYRQSRGGWSRILALSCKACGRFLFHYQKDGPGAMKRSYLDRIINAKPAFDNKGYFFCLQCHVCLGFNEPYAKEHDRPAVRWAMEAIDYKVIAAKSL